MADHGNGIALAFARTETAMFQRHVWLRASAVLMLASRPHFYRPDGTRACGNSGGPICLIAYGDANRRALSDSGLPGAVIVVHHYQNSKNPTLSTVTPPRDLRTQLPTEGRP